MRRIARLLFPVLVITLGCTNDPGPLTPQKVWQNHTAMFEEVRTYLDRPELFVDGEWQLHYGDGSMFGPSFDLAEWKRTGDSRHYDRAIAALENNRALVEAATEKPADYLDQLETLSMSLLSLIEAGIYLDPEEAKPYQEAADNLLIPLDFLASTYSDYLEIDQGEFAATTYGPTALSAFLALMHLEHVLAYPSVNPEHHLTRGQAVLESIRERAWDPEMGAYRFAPDDERLMLYPNITVMLAYARADQLTGDNQHRQYFDATYQGIQPLKNPAGDHYHSPYSAEEMGALDEDYSTLSSQNYLMLALVAAYRNTGDIRYLQETDTILGWIADKLLVDGQILHHWVNGHAATEAEPWVYCLGCNVQTLYILLLVENSIAGMVSDP